MAKNCHSVALLICLEQIGEVSQSTLGVEMGETLVNMSADLETLLLKATKAAGENNSDLLGAPLTRESLSVWRGECKLECNASLTTSRAEGSDVAAVSVVDSSAVAERETLCALLSDEELEVTRQINKADEVCQEDVVAASCNDAVEENSVVLSAPSSSQAASSKAVKPSQYDKAGAVSLSQGASPELSRKLTRKERRRLSKKKAGNQPVSDVLSTGSPGSAISSVVVQTGLSQEAYLLHMKQSSQHRSDSGTTLADCASPKLARRLSQKERRHPWLSKKKTEMPTTGNELTAELRREVGKTLQEQGNVSQARKFGKNDRNRLAEDQTQDGKEGNGAVSSPAAVKRKAKCSGFVDIEPKKKKKKRKKGAQSVNGTDDIDQIFSALG